MHLLTNKNILDLIPYGNGVIVVQVQQTNGENRVVYRGFDVKTCEPIPTTKGVYLINKYGPAYESIVADLDNPIACNAFLSEDRRCFVLTPSGQLSIYNSEGKRLHRNQLLYHDSVLRSGVCVGKYFWCTVPNENSLVQYDMNSLNVHLRIGSEDKNTFSTPYFLTYNNEKLIVTNSSTGIVSEMDLDNYSVRKIKKFDEQIYLYYLIQGKEIVWLKSGIYVL